MVQSTRDKPIKYTTKMVEVEERFDINLQEDVKHLVSVYTQFQIAQRFGIARSTVRWWLEAFNIEIYTIGLAKGEKITVTRLDADDEIMQHDDYDKR